MSVLQNENQLRADICEVGRRMWQRGYVAANDGNISARLDEHSLLVTPTGVSKGFMTPEMLIKVDLYGNIIAGLGRASSELKMHLAAYQLRPDINCVVHAHPPIATAYAVAGLAITQPIVAEVVVNLGYVPLVPYGTPGSDELPAVIAQHLANHDGLLLANHGALTVGEDLYTAYYKMETMELVAQIGLYARLLGGAHEISPENVQKLHTIRDQLQAKKNG